MLGSPLTARSENCHQPATIYTLTPIKQLQGTGILQRSTPNIVFIQPPLSQHSQKQQRPKSKLTPIRPAPLAAPVAPVILTPVKRKPTTVREMLRTRKKIQMIERQQKQLRQIPADQKQEQLIPAQQTERRQIPVQQTEQRQIPQRKERHIPAYQIIQHQVAPNTHSRRGNVKQSTPSGRAKSGKKKGRPVLPHKVGTMDKKEIHRVNERHRHRNMNQAIRQLVSVLPKNSAPETETKQFVLQKANDYLTYLRNKINHVCDEMAVIQENEEEGLMSFDIPFENISGAKNVSVPTSKPITHSDLKDLLGPTSALRLSDPPPKRKSPTVKPVPKEKTKHQPWFEINIKMSVSPYKKRSPQGRAPSTSTKTKLSKRSATKKKKKSTMKTMHTPRGRHHTINHDENGDQVSSFQSPSSVCSWASVGDIKDKTKAYSTSTQSSCQSNKCEVISDDEVDVDLTCVDVLSPDEEVDLLTTNTSSEDDVIFQQLASPDEEVDSLTTNTSTEDDVKFQQLASPDVHPVSMYTSSSSYEDEARFHQWADYQPPSFIAEDHTSEDCDSIPWIRYGLTPSSGLGADGQLQIDHSYSARALSPLTLQGLRSSADKDQVPESALSQHDDFITGSACGSDSTSLPVWRKSPTFHELPDQNVDALLQNAILMEPPVECIPPRSPINEGNMEVIRVFGLDFDEDSESSGGSLSQNSPEMFEAGVDTVAASFAPKQSSMRRSWINGYQLFTKINHARIKQSWPGLQGREITRLLGQSWKDLPDTYKKLYSIRACEWNQWYREMRGQNGQEH